MLSRKSILKSQRINILLLVILFSSNSIIGQENNSLESNKDIMASVYEDVWLPFMESYRELNIEKFKSIQAQDLTRVSIDRNTIQETSKYFEEIEGFFNQIKQLNRQMDVKFSILTTAIGSHKVYQTGYYGISTKASSSEPYKPMGYGYFTVVLTKEDGKWKISLDADKQSSIDEAEFRKSELIYELK